MSSSSVLKFARPESEVEFAVLKPDIRELIRALDDLEACCSRRGLTVKYLDDSRENIKLVLVEDCGPFATWSLPRLALFRAYWWTRATLHDFALIF
jgi:hypothetical protein